MRRTRFTSIVCATGVVSLLGLIRPVEASDHGLELAPALPAAPSVQLQPPSNLSLLNPLTVPVFNSWSGSAGSPKPPPKIYLDFDGDTTSSWGGYSPGTTPAYDIDGDPTTFSDAELNNIVEIASRVAEYFSPFNINVTTVAPASLGNFNAMRVVIGGTGLKDDGTYWWGGSDPAGGIGFTEAFINFEPNTAFVFSGNLRHGEPKFSAMAAAHELGHSFGLLHQSIFDEFGTKTVEYNPGTSEKAPLMGISYRADRGVWYSGPAGSSFNIQEDAEVIANTSTNRFGYRPDDYPDALDAAAPMDVTGNQIFISGGVIESIGDVDFFKFHVDLLSLAVINLNHFQFGGMLDPSLELYDLSDGSLIESVATAALDELLVRNLSPGDYGLAVRSAGYVGDVGQYDLYGMLLTPGSEIPEPAGLGLVLGMGLLCPRRRRHG